jgi:hypothetical protein
MNRTNPHYFIGKTLVSKETGYHHTIDYAYKEDGVVYFVLDEDSETPFEVSIDDNTFYLA